MKKLFLYTTIFLTLVIILYNHDTIASDYVKSDIEKNLNKKINIEGHKFYDNEKFIFFTSMDKKHVGYAIYKKNLFNRYSKVRTSLSNYFYSSNVFTEHIADKYVTTIFIGGKNLSNKISYFKIFIQNKEIKEYVDSKFFFHQYKFSFDSINQNKKFFDIKFYDKEGNDITDVLHELYTNQ
ncbi:hypothetical protein [Paramaledivibacter caminithermalis]|uniref:Uncharacterized protein n=1 Tax=Paramaledivibacter caminithermalis (strain DSM 15212 / CIP 107654 / DViRD3) TaxID=1121301 RepID=A0A1M6MKE8_PARC5|nr:hypothetical protein [Paramaledivibacter caminithermalis]SHJ83951.1 hypothetical protein SAMN02745912_01281 [Paramaledivibacter caminithermalis DSM 15212]